MHLAVNMYTGEPTIFPDISHIHRPEGKLGVSFFRHCQTFFFLTFKLLTTKPPLLISLLPFKTRPSIGLKLAKVGWPASEPCLPSAVNTMCSAFLYGFWGSN